MIAMCAAAESYQRKGGGIGAGPRAIRATAAVAGPAAAWRAWSLFWSRGPPLEEREVLSTLIGGSTKLTLKGNCSGETKCCAVVPGAAAAHLVRAAWREGRAHTRGSGRGPSRLRTAPHGSAPGPHCASSRLGTRGSEYDPHCCVPARN